MEERRKKKEKEKEKEKSEIIQSPLHQKSFQNLPEPSRTSRTFQHHSRIIP